MNGIAVLANLIGSAPVDVKMRGRGVLGWRLFFEPLQNLDSYDVIETIAHQPCVLDHIVGMLGISYGGISRLLTAQLDPPHLEAIPPLSVIDTTATTLYPSGILNTGFAVPWAGHRQQETEPAGASSGQPWACQRIEAGPDVWRQSRPPPRGDRPADLRSEPLRPPEPLDTCKAGHLARSTRAVSTYACGR